MFLLCLSHQSLLTVTHPPTPTLSPAENTPPVCMKTPVITPVPGQVTPPQMFSFYSCCCDNTRTEGRLDRKASLRLTRGSPLWKEARAGTQVKNLKQKAERNTDYLLAHLPRAGTAHAVLDSPILISKQENAPQICTQASPINPPSNPPSSLFQIFWTMSTRQPRLAISSGKTLASFQMKKDIWQSRDAL